MNHFTLPLIPAKAGTRAFSWSAPEWTLSFRKELGPHFRGDERKNGKAFQSFLAGLSCLAALTIASAANAAWVQTWGASPEPPSAARGRFPGSPGFSDQTIRQVVRISAGGRRLRIRLTNEFGAAPLTIGAVHVALAGAGGAIRPGTDRVLTFAGRPSAVIPPGAPLLSDPVAFDTPVLGSLAVSLYLPMDTGPCTCHATGMQTAYVAGPGDLTGSAVLPGASKLQARTFLSGVEVDGGRPARAIVVLGDSISDGVGSTPDANHRWPDLLADRLVKRGTAFGVVNQGISGNRLLHDGAGVSALARFDRDVLATPGAAYVILFEGVNDLGLSNPPPDLAKIFGRSGDPVSADDLIAADKQMIARAHAHGLKVYGATITPYKGAIYWSAEGEAKRQAINAWIRKGGDFDGVIDFDAVLRDPADPGQIRPGYHAGDHLHGSDAGYRAMADAIDLGLFAGGR